MHNGIPFFSHYGLVGYESEMRVKIGEELIDIDKLEVPLSIWSQTEIDLSGRDSITGIEINIEAKIDFKDDCKGYDWLKFPDFFEFVVVLSNTSSRKRTCFRGSTSPVRHQGNNRPVRYEGKVENRLIDLAEFSGEIKLEPIFVVRSTVMNGKLLDTNSNMFLVPGTVVAYCEPIRIILNREKRGLMSLFEFVWRPFSKVKDLDLPDVGIFSVKWETSPKLFLNQDIENLESILTSEAKVGNYSVARDNINLIIAHQVVTSVLGLIIRKILNQRAEYPEDSAEEIVLSLDSQERQFLSSWSYVLDPAHSQTADLNSAVEKLLELEDSEVDKFITKDIPDILQYELGSQASVEKMIKVLSKRDGGDEYEQF